MIAEYSFNAVRKQKNLLAHHITADKREIRDFPKLPSATSFIRKTLSEIVDEGKNIISWRNINHILNIIWIFDIWSGKK